MNNWLFQAFGSAVAASAALNGAPFLPFLRDIEPRRIEARWVGYVGLFVAFGLWLAFDAHRPAWQAFAACGVIWFTTLVPNTLVHWRKRNAGGGGTRVVEIRLSDEGEALLEEMIKERAPRDADLARLFKLEQRRETAGERWEDILMPRGLLGLLDEAIACVVRGMAEDNQNWFLTAVADVREARDAVCKSKWRLHLWYRLFWPEHAA